MSTPDPVTVAVIQGALEGIAIEMGHKLMRMAHSSIIRESEDFGTAILNIRGEQLCESIHSTPLQSGPMPGYVRGILRAFEARGESFRPGDVVMHNDPYGGASHGPDVAFVVPIFDGDRLVAFSGVAAHHVDIGAMSPGSSGIVEAIDAYAEGLQFKAIKVIEAGVPNRHVWHLLRDNLRVSHIVIGDMQAQIEAAEIGARRFRDLAARYGLATVLSASDVILDQSERLMRAAIAKLPDGVYRAENFLDGFLDSVDPRHRNLRLAVAITVAGETIDVDLSGTSPQIDDRPLNMPFVGTVDCAVWLTLKSVLLDEAVHGPAPHNSGLVRPITIRAPEGSLANPRFPAPTIARACAGNHLADTVMKALGHCVPERIAAGIGAPKGVAFTGHDGDRHWVHLEVFEGAYGGRYGKDGMDSVDTLYVNTRNNPIEDIETHSPLRVERYELRENSAGAGRWRGGFGSIRAFRMLTDGGLSVEGDGQSHKPWPFDGGSPGTTSQLVLQRASGSIESLPSKVSYRRSTAGDLLTVIGGSGGGYGAPEMRDPAAVLTDIEDGLISAVAALRDYAVVVRDGRVDENATAVERAARLTPSADPGDWEVTLERLDPTSFAAFGSVLDIDAFSGRPLDVGHGAPIAFEAQESPALLHVRFATAEPAFDLVERHLFTDQGFFPLEPKPVIMTVGLEAKREAMRAFLLDGRHGVVLRAGVWHSLARFPVEPGGALFLMATGRETEAELRAHEAGVGGLTRTEMVSLADHAYRRVRVVDRDGLLSGIG
jgi:N-methylhydantoinase B